MWKGETLMGYTKLSSLLLLSLLLISLSQHILFFITTEALSIIQDATRSRRVEIISLGRDSYEPLNYSHNIMLTLEDISRSRSAIIGSRSNEGSDDKIVSRDTAIPLGDRRVIVLRSEINYSSGDCFLYYILYNDYLDKTERIYRYRADPYFCTYPSYYDDFKGYTLLVGPNYTLYLVKLGYNYYIGYPRSDTIFNLSVNLSTGNWTIQSGRTLQETLLVVAKLGDERPEAKAFYVGKGPGMSHLPISRTEDSNALYTQEKGGPSISFPNVVPLLYMLYSRGYWEDTYIYYDLLTKNYTLQDPRARAGIAILNLDRWEDPEVVFFYRNATASGFTGKAIRTSDGGYLVAGFNNNPYTDDRRGRCDIVLLKYSRNLSLEWSRKYILNLTAYYSALNLTNLAGNLTKDLRRDCENLFVFHPQEASWGNLHPSLRQGYGTGIVNLHEVVEGGISKGYIVGISPSGGWTSPKGVSIYLYGFIAFMVDPRGKVLWNNQFYTLAGTQSHQIAPIGGGLAVMASTASWFGPWGCCEYGSWFYWINTSSGETYYYQPMQARTYAQRQELAYFTWLDGRGTPSSLGNSSGVLFTRYAHVADGSPYSDNYVLGYSTLEIGFATYEDILGITNRVAPPPPIYFVESVFNATESGYVATRYRPLVISFDKPTPLPTVRANTSLSIVPSEDAKRLGNIAAPDPVEIRVGSFFRYPRMLLPGQLSPTSEPRTAWGGGPIVNNYIDLGSLKTGDQITYRIQGIKLSPNASEAAPSLRGDPHISNSVEGVKISAGNYSSAGLKQKFYLDVVIDPRTAGPRAFHVVFNPYSTVEFRKPSYRVEVNIPGYVVSFAALVRDYVPVVNASYTNTSIKLPLSTAIVNSPFTTRPGVPERYNVHITNIGTEEAVFIYGVLMPFYTRVNGVLGGDMVFSISGVEDGDLVALFALKIPPGGLRTVQVIATVGTSYIDEFNPKGDGWRGWKISVLGRGFDGYSPMAVQLAALPPMLWENLTRDLGRNPLALLDRAINVSSILFEERIANLSKIDGLSKELQRLRDTGLYGKVLADYIEEELWRRIVIEPVAADLMSGENNQMFALNTPAEILTTGYQDLLTEAKSRFLGNYTIKGIEKLPPAVAQLVLYSHIYNVMMLITRMINPVFSYQLAEVSINRGGGQSGGVSTASNTLSEIFSIVPKASGGIRVVSSESLQLQQSQGSSSTTMLVDLTALSQCFDRTGKMPINVNKPIKVYNPLTGKEMIFDPSTGKLIENNKPLPAEMLDKILRAMYPWVEEAYEKFKDMSPHEILLYALANNDRLAFEYYNLLSTGASTSGGVGGVSGFLPFSDLLIASLLDSAGLTPVLAKYGLYFGGAAVDASSIGQAKEAFDAGVLVGSVYSLAIPGTQITKGDKITKAWDLYSTYLKYAKNIKISSPEALDNIRILDPKGTLVAYTISNNLLDAYKTASTGLQGMEKASKTLEELSKNSEKILKELGLKKGQIEDIFAVDGKVFRFGSTAGDYVKPFVIEVKYPKAAEGQDVVGALITLSQNPKTGQLYIGISHSDKISKLDGGKKVVYGADIHFTPEQAYTFSLLQGKAVVDKSLTGLSQSEVIDFFNNHGFKATANYIANAKLGEGVSPFVEAAAFNKLYNDLLVKLKGADLDAVKKAMAEGKYDDILKMAEKYGVPLDRSKVDVVDMKEFPNTNPYFNDNIDLLRKAAAAAKQELGKEIGDVNMELAKLGLLTAAPMSNAIYHSNYNMRDFYNKFFGPLDKDCDGISNLPSSVNIKIGNVSGQLSKSKSISPRSTSPRIVGSVDPNQVTVDPRGFITQRGQALRIMVEFENLANATAAAVNVSVKLYMKGALDPDSVELLDLSHRNVFLSMGKDVEKGSVVISINLTEINLPPNKRPPEGQGWALVGVRASEKLLTGDTVEIYADIVFDYNPPIRTNVERLIVDLDPPVTMLKEVKTTGSSTTIVGECMDKGSGCDQALVQVKSPVSREVVRSTIIKFNSTETDGKASFETTFDDIDPGEYEITLVSVDRAGNSEEKARPDGIAKIEKKIQTVTPIEPGTRTPVPSPTQPTPAITSATTSAITPLKGNESSKEEITGPQPPLIMIAIAVITIAAIAIAIMLYRRKTAS
jgi:hypothetical protein